MLLVQRTVKEVPGEVSIVGGTILHFGTAVGAVDQTGKDTAPAGAGHAVPLLADHRDFLKRIVLDDALMGVGENSLFLNRIVPLFLVPDGVGAGLEVDGATRILPAFQNTDNRTAVPLIGIFRNRRRSRSSTILPHSHYFS